MNVLELQKIYIIRLSVIRPCSSLEIYVTVFFNYRVFSDTCLFIGFKAIYLNIFTDNINMHNL